MARVSGRPAEVSQLAPGRSIAAGLIGRLEAEYDRWFLWLPVMFGAGIAAYFALPSEPSLGAAVLPVAGALALYLGGPEQAWPGS